jgi:BolA protein
MTEREHRIRTILIQAFAPTDLAVEDDSARHAGHAGAAPGGGTHFSVRVVSAAFAGLSRVERHRRVNAALGEELTTGLHALAITAKAPGEA